MPRHNVKKLSLSSLELIPVRVRAASRVSKKDTSMGFAASATFLSVGGSTDGLLRFFDSAGSLIHTETIPETTSNRPSIATHVLYGKLDTRPFLAVATDTGRVLVFELNVWAYGKLLLGDRRVQKRAAAEAALNETAAVKEARATVQLSASTPAAASPAELLAAQGTEFAVLLNLTAELDLDGAVADFFANDALQSTDVAAEGEVGVAASSASSQQRSAVTHAPTAAQRTITSLEIFAHQGKRLIIAGDSLGCISVISSDGAVEHVFIPRPSALATTEAVHEGGKAVIARTVRPAPITALAKGTNLLAYSMDKIIGFISVSRQVFQAHMCHAVSDVRVIVQTAVHTAPNFCRLTRWCPWRLTQWHALCCGLGREAVMCWCSTHGTSSKPGAGRLSASVSHANKACRVPPKNAPACFFAVQHRISAETNGPFSSVVRSLRGHVLVANGNNLRVFNSSRVQRDPPHLLAQSSLGNRSSAGSLLATAIGPAGSDQESEMRVSFFDAGESQLVGFEALLSTKRESSSDFNWFRIPM